MKKKKKEKQEYKLNFPIFMRILRYVRPYMKQAVLCVVISLLISILHFASLGMIKPLGDLLFGDGSDVFLKRLAELGPTGQQVSSFLGQHVFNDPYRALYVIMVFTIGLVVVKNILRFIQEYLAAYVTCRAVADIRNELFDKTIVLPIETLYQKGTSQTSNLFIQDVLSIRIGIKSILGKAIREPFKALGTMAIAVLINWKLTLFIFFVFPLALVIIRKIGKSLKKGVKKRLKRYGELLALLNETFDKDGIKTIKSYQLEKHQSEKFQKENERLYKSMLKVMFTESLTSPIMEIIVTVAGFGILIFSGQLVLAGEMSKGDFLAFYGALGALFDPVRKLADVNNRVNEAVAAGERVFQVMDQQPEPYKQENKKTLDGLKQEIVFDSVVFQYPTGEEPALNGLSFKVNQGERIAIVGESGAGKSTLISLLARFYDVGSGKILIDGNDIRDFSLESVRRNIGLVMQRAFLFQDTIHTNICGEENDQERSAEAAKLAFAHEFIEELPSKYDTMYGKNGAGLSGGQQHRVSLARAIARNPSILILDEAMANLDAKSEDYIKAALEKFTQGRTCFIIAHRFSTINNADRILVINKGKVDGFGTHQEMMETSKIYRDLYTRQMDTEVNDFIGETKTE